MTTGTLNPIKANSATGTPVATREVNSTNYQMVMLTDVNGNPHGGIPSFLYYIPATSFAAGKHIAAIQVRSNAGKVMEITGVWGAAKVDGALVPTTQMRFDFYRTNSFTTVGSNWSYLSSSVDAVGGNLSRYNTGNINPTSYTLGTLYPSSMGVSEFLFPGWYTGAASASQNPGFLQQFFNMIPEAPRSVQRLSFQPNEGLLIKGGSNAGSGAVGFLVAFTLEDLLT